MVLNKRKSAAEKADTPAAQEIGTVVVTVDRGLPDLPFLALTVLLLAFGLIMMFSASYPAASTSADTNYNGAYYFNHQLIFALVGLAAMLVIAYLSPLYSLLKHFARMVMLTSIGLLIIVLFYGVITNGSRRWLPLGFTDFQPSEIAKAAVVLFFSAKAVAKGNHMKDFRSGCVYFLVILAVLAILMMLEPHLSGTVIIVTTGICMMLLGGTRVKHLLLTLGGLALPLILCYVIFGKIPFLQSYMQDRITAWRDPQANAGETGYQIIQSLYAIGSGGLLGLGLGNSRQKYLYLPYAHNDYIFSVVCEELGFVGACVVILLFALLILRGYYIAMLAEDRFQALMAAGFTTLLAIQVFLNIGVVSNFLPSTGISLPFFSYGGTALLMTMAEMGVVLGVSREKKSSTRRRVS